MHLLFSRTCLQQRPSRPCSHKIRSISRISNFFDLWVWTLAFLDKYLIHRRSSLLYFFVSRNYFSAFLAASFNYWGGSRLNTWAFYLLPAGALANLIVVLILVIIVLRIYICIFYCDLFVLLFNCLLACHLIGLLSGLSYLLMRYLLLLFRRTRISIIFIFNIII
jgi:hypothetical protein